MSFQKVMWEGNINRHGVPAVFKQVKPPSVEIEIDHVGWSTVNKEDSQLIQAIGFGARIITIKASSMTGIAPSKFDTLVVAGVPYVADTVNPVLEPGTGNLLGWRVFVRGG